MSNRGVTPFLKWAGGKRWLAPKLRALFPDRFGTYFEPFLGSGAIFFDLLPGSAMLSDINLGLINTYRAIKSQPQEVYSALSLHASQHCKEYYYKTRGLTPTDLVEEAARFIYLNRTCWNGLYRENKSGKFNVPIGTKDRVLLETDDFLAIARTLDSVDLRCEDFESVIDRAEENDLIYVDPPYTTAHNFNGFVRYNNTYFEWIDQQRLMRALSRAAARGACIVMSNADHISVRDLYRGIGDLRAISRSTVIAANSSRRGKTSELVMVLNATA